MSESIIPFMKNKPLSTFENQLCRFCFIELASREWQCYSPPIFYFNLPLRQGRCSKCSQKSRQYQSAYCIPLLLLAEEKKKILISNSGSGCWQKKVNQDEIVLPLKCMWKIYFGSTSVQRWRHCSSMAITLIQGDKRKFDNLLVSIPPPPPVWPFTPGSLSRLSISASRQSRGRMLFIGHREFDRWLDSVGPAGIVLPLISNQIEFIPSQNPGSVGKASIHSPFLMQI